MKLRVAIRNPRLRSGIGAALAVLCGLALWQTALGEKWINASFDYLFRFGKRKVTNQVVLIQQPRRLWDRGAYTQLANRLADEKCPLVVFDVHFVEASDSPVDVALLSALARLDRVALMARQIRDHHPKLPSGHPVKPAPAFLAAAKTNWGVAQFDWDHDRIVRKHWPFPAPEPAFSSLPWTAAKLAGASLSDEPREQWLRYYSFEGPWSSFSYSHASNQVAEYFRDKIVFIGNQPQSPAPDGEEDEFSTPYTRWEKEACGGIYLVATAFLNLMNHEWLRRPAWPVEGAMLLLTGGLLGGFMCRLRPLASSGAALGCALGATLAGVTLSYATNFWVPWLIVAGGQAPCALVWAWIARPKHVELSVQEILESPWMQGAPNVGPVVDGALPDAADYELVHPPFAHGGFGKVWLARNAIGQWQALKAVYAAKFGDNRIPYEAEFHGIQNYKPISDKHPGLLRVDFVSKQKPDGYFYYVMELGDAITPGWQQDPGTYKPRDLASVIRQAEHNRLPVSECVRIVSRLAEALDFLHHQGFTHRDIKPSNIIFVNGWPKLADVGLVREIRPVSEITTWAGTLGYMPPQEERPGTIQADIYALGMVLYVISTGKAPALFPELSTTLAQMAEGPEFIHLNSIILKACDPVYDRRFPSAAALWGALAEVQKLWERRPSPEIPAQP